MSKNYFYGRITSNHLERGIFYDVTPLRTYKWTMGTNQRLFPPYSTGRPPKRSNREMFNAILWIARSGAPWRDLRTITAYGKPCMLASANGVMKVSY